MFLGVDCYWAFFMAINVYLVFFRGYTTESLRKLEVIYLLLGYGLSFIPALVFVFISTPSRGHFYGNAIIWCWITPKRDWARFVFLYGIVWIDILIAFVVYGMAAKVIWQKRRHLDGFLNPLNENPFTNLVTTEIEITTDERPIAKEGATQGMADSPTDIDDSYSVHIHADPPTRENRPLPASLRIRTITRDAAESATNAEAWLYARVAILFFIALLITWVPSSVNRLYAVIRPNNFCFALNYISSFVFPLQGFWNVIVYIITSQTACKKLCRQIFGGKGYDGRTTRNATNLADGSDDRDIDLKEGKQRLESVSSSSTAV